MSGSGLVMVELRPLTAAGLERLLAGERDPAAAWHPDYPMAETFVAGQLTLDGSAGIDPAPWGTYQIVLDGCVVGDAGFHGPVDECGTVEIGYNVVAEQRGRGIASASCRALVALAWQENAVRILAETDEDNVASQRVLVNAGFAPFDKLRERTGEPRVFMISRPARRQGRRA